MNQQEKLLLLACKEIEQDCGDYSALEDLLNTLYQALLNRSSEQVESVNSKISQRLEKIRARAERRPKILAATGVVNESTEISPQAMECLFALLPQSQRKQVDLQWQRLQTQVTTARKLNERNGKLLAMQREIFQQLVNGPNQSDYIYSPQGY